MRPNTAVAERQGDLGGEKVAMSFDQNSLAHIMSVLTDLYSDPELAIIREYSTNALDAQKRAGVSRPIEIVTPNTLTPFFKVKDYGIGMDATDIREIYSQYGASTKRDSDEFTGMLGLGCKAALTYTNQFTVNAVKDGIRTQVVVSRTETGAGIMEIIAQTETDEDNGVEIVVPVKKYNTFERKSKNFFKYWDEGTVLMNGEAPEQLEGRKLSDTMTVVPGMEHDVIVMGNVPYPVESGRDIHAKDYRSRYGIVARVNIGEVSFTPSRESLHYTQRTEKTLATLRDAFKDLIVDATQRDVNAAPDKFAALKVYSDWSKTLFGNVQSNRKVKYNGEEIPTNVRVTKGMNFKLSHSRYAVDDARYETIDSLHSRVVIYGYKNTDLKGHNREKIRLWANQNNIATRGIVLVVDELPDIFGEWISTENTYDWEDVRLTKAPKTPGVPREKPSYDVWIPDDHMRMVSLDEISDTALKGLISSKEWKDFGHGFMTSFRKFFKDVTVVRIANNRWDKFKRDKKNVKTLQDIVLDRFNEVRDSLTESDKLFMKIDWSVRNTLNVMDDTQVDDPDLAAMIRVSRMLDESDTIKEYKELKALLNQFTYAPYKPVELSETMDVFSKYPMLGSSQRLPYDKRNHAVLYVNSVYASSLSE